LFYQPLVDEDSDGSYVLRQGCFRRPAEMKHEFLYVGPHLTTSVITHVLYSMQSRHFSSCSS